MIFGDKAYDSKPIYNMFGNDAVIPPWRNASSHSTRSPSRASMDRQIRKTSERRGRESVDYGRRWNVETYFSGLKRTIGEIIKAVRADYIVQVIALKVQYYNDMRRMTYTY